MSTPAVAYIRVSSTNRAHHDDAKSTQFVSCVRYAEQNGLFVDEAFTDLGVSGATSASDRDGFIALLDYLEDATEPTVVIVTEGCRLSRNGTYMELAIQMIRDLGHTVHDVTDGEFVIPDDESAAAWFQRTVLQLIPEFERRTVVERLQRGKARVRDSGGFTGGRPKTPADVCAWIIALHKDGTSGRAIAVITNTSTATVSRCLAAARQQGIIS